jgi:uncharacterized hydrophobic protein (TIGR00271 family)
MHKNKENSSSKPDFRSHPLIKQIKKFWETWIISLIPARVGETKIHNLYRALNYDASWNLNYVVFIIGSCLIATFGLISNSAAVIIGAMIIAPLMLPLRAMAFGALEGDYPLFKKALFSVISGTVLAFSISWFIGKITGIPTFGSEVLARTQPNLVDLGIAVTAGGISGFAKIRRKVSDVLAGTAIAVALMPPLCVVGLSLSQHLFSYSLGAFLLYLTNLLGIVLACMIVFIIAGYTQPNHALGWALSLTAVLFLPLGLSFWQLVKQSQIRETVKQTLLNKTVTLGQRKIDLKDLKINWTQDPPLISLTVQTQEEITPRQVLLVQEFVSEEIQQKFQIIFLVEQIDIVYPENNDEK